MPAQSEISANIFGFVRFYDYTIFLSHVTIEVVALLSQDRQPEGQIEPNRQSSRRVTQSQTDTDSKIDRQTDRQTDRY